MNKHILKLAALVFLFIFCHIESNYSQRPTTFSFSMVYDFNYFDTNRNVHNYYESTFNKLRKEETQGRPSDGNGIEISYALSKKWMGSLGYYNINYNYEQRKGPFDYELYGFRFFSFPISFKYYPLMHSEHLSVEAGINVDNMRSQYGVGFLMPMSFSTGWEYIEKFQLGYQIGVAMENHSSKKLLLSFGVNFKSNFTELSKSNLTIHAGEVLSAIGLESKIGYRFLGRP